MATSDVLLQEDDLFLPNSLLDPRRREESKSSGMCVEKKIEFLESLMGKVSNRKSRRLLNDRILMELVPRLNGEEIRGLFAPPPWGDVVPPSPFSMTDVREWDKFRNIDMDKEAKIIGAFQISSAKRRSFINADKLAVLNAWHRVDCRTREALRRSFLPDMIEGYEACIRAFIADCKDEDVLMLQVQDPFHRLLLHGVCEFYNLASTTLPPSNGTNTAKTTKITRKKKGSEADVPNITLTQFLKMSKAGIW